MKKRNLKVLFLALIITGVAALWVFPRFVFHPFVDIGQPIDSLNGVPVYFNGRVGHVAGRHVAADGYNLGLRYQCVEFVKRYYHDHLHHRMPETYGHAKDFFIQSLPDGRKNTQRKLIQFTNPGSSKPQVEDILVFDASPFNPYGHVAIISEVTPSRVEIIQQNPGPFHGSRQTLKLTHTPTGWRINHNRVLGWLRKK